MSKILMSILLLLLQLPWLSAQGQDLIPGPAPTSLPEGLQTVEFFSPAVGRNMKFDVILPPGYGDSEQDYPVLYLLHGYMQNYTVWGRNLAAAWYARQVDELILVMPDAGNSWYINYARSDGGQRNNWEDHIINDVIPTVDARFRSIAAREGRAIAGLSMGGFGALALGLRHPDKFISLGSSSGALSHARDIARALHSGMERRQAPVPGSEDNNFQQADAFVADIISIDGFSTQQERTPQGIDFLRAEQAEAYDPFQIIYNVPRSQMPHIYLDAGTSDSLIAVTRELMSLLLINNVPFQYRQAEGGHTADYWRRAIGPMLNSQNEVMQRALGWRP
ncbi:MAG: esterase family protein [Pseudomonadales bacterium]|nr:esterase family protein [Pseudomonadales bacterium]